MEASLGKRGETWLKNLRKSTVQGFPLALFQDINPTYLSKKRRLPDNPIQATPLATAPNLQ
jgi:hypothetical protein